MTALLLRLAFVLAGAIAGGISGACAALWLRGLDHVQATGPSTDDPETVDVKDAWAQRNRPIHDGHPARSGR